ncbi:MAG TPA: twin-arginine translocase TatA/TatE family subunit [Thermoanaerobaculia bacterium]|nr:twin-arginine translocase TatA/TatE family subunit [Thermoanaerobaculia bacterium]
MGSLGLPELAFIFVLALLVFGPKKMPEIGRTLGKGMTEFRKAANELKRTVNAELALEENPMPASVRSQLRQAQAEPSVAAALQEPREAPAETEPRTPPAPAFETIDEPQPVEPK